MVWWCSFRVGHTKRTPAVLGVLTSGHAIRMKISHKSLELAEVVGVGRFGDKIHPNRAAHLGMDETRGKTPPTNGETIAYIAGRFGHASFAFDNLLRFSARDKSAWHSA